ncbi:MAG: MaoC family dehydratase [Rhodobacteraceae bacterium]|nr:MaoC family dehydratase [Paracoccaceae bacterium]MCY4195885.1 MaoC family dehydratase [Paracoccaceae bacterium]
MDSELGSPLEPAAGRQLGPGRYFFDALAVGDWYRTGSVEITADLISKYAELSGDRYRLHLEDEAAREFGFVSRIAHGLLILGLADGLKFQSPVQLDAVASLGWDIKFTKPVFVGDRISACLTIHARRSTSQGDRGIVTLAVSVRNQDEMVVQHGFNRLMMRLICADISQASHPSP